MENTLLLRDAIQIAPINNNVIFERTKADGRHTNSNKDATQTKAKTLLFRKYNKQETTQTKTLLKPSFLNALLDKPFSNCTV